MYDVRHSRRDITMMPVRVKLQPTAQHPRERMIRSAIALMGEQGVEATSLAQVIEHSGAPRGSIYHHFPGGKAQLVEEATRYAGEFIAAGLAEAITQEDLVGAIDGFVAFWCAALRDSDFAAGCPVVAATLEADGAPGARAAAGAAFARWETLVADMLRRNGLPEER